MKVQIKLIKLYFSENSKNLKIIMMLLQSTLLLIISQYRRYFNCRIKFFSPNDVIGNLVLTIQNGATGNPSHTGSNIATHYFRLLTEERDLDK